MLAVVKHWVGCGAAREGYDSRNGHGRFGAFGPNAASGAAVGGRPVEPVARDPAQADLAVPRLDAPFETLHPQFTVGSMQHEGRLDWPAVLTAVRARALAHPRAALLDVAAAVPVRPRARRAGAPGRALGV